MVLFALFCISFNIYAQFSDGPCGMLSDQSVLVYPLNYFSWRMYYTVAATGFLSHYLGVPYPYSCRHINSK